MYSQVHSWHDGEHMQLKAFCPRTRQTFDNAILDQATNTVRLTARRKPVSRKQVVLLPPIGISDAQGAPVYLGDAFTLSIDGREETYIVGPLPAAGELVTEFALRGYKAQSASRLDHCFRKLELTPDVVATLERAGNAFTDFEKFVPENAHYCYKGLGWSGQYYELVSCPFWQRSNHGVVYCRLLQKGSVIDDSEAEYKKALAHFGTEDAVEAARELWLVWDQVKACDVNVDVEDDESDFVQDEN
jgi:hypothetical protein